GVHPDSETTAPASDPRMIGLRTGWASTNRHESRPLVVASRTSSTTGASTSSCRRITGTTAVASPSTYTATGRPMLFALTYPEPAAPTTASGAGSRSHSRSTSTNTPALTTAEAAATASGARTSAPTSARARTVNSRAGLATKNPTRLSTVLASGPPTPRRAATYPTATTRAMIANPVRTAPTRQAAGTTTGPGRRRAVPGRAYGAVTRRARRAARRGPPSRG